MKSFSEQLSKHHPGDAMALVITSLMLAVPMSAVATDYIFNPASGTHDWSTSTIWTPDGVPGDGDNIDATLISASGATVRLLGTTRTINDLTKTVANRWNINGNAAALSTLNVNNIHIATNNMAFLDGSGGVGLQVNATNISVTSGGGLYFGTTSNSSSNLQKGLSVSGTTSVSGTGFLRLNVVNAAGSSFSLGLLDVSGSGVVTLANAPTGKASTTANVSGLSGSGGFVQANLALSQTGNVATLAINNSIDHSSATVLRDGVSTDHGGTLLLSKSGIGTQILTGANTYTGTTTINAGTLQFGKQVSLYNNTLANWTAENLIVNSGATAAFNIGGTGEFTSADLDTLLALGTATGGFKDGARVGLDTTNASGGSFTYGSVIANSNSGANALGLTKLGTGTLILSGVNTYSGGTSINDGVLSISADSGLGIAPPTATPAHLTFNGGTLATTDSFTLDANRGVSLGASGGTFDVADTTTLSYGGIMADSGSLTKTGTGTLALSGASSYTGATNVNAGTLAISNNMALGTVAGGVTVANLATLQLSGDITVGDEALSLTGDGAVAGIGALQNLSGNNTWGGDITVTAGATRIDAAAGSSLLITGDIITNGTGNLNIGGAGDMEISGVISGGLQIFKSSVVAAPSPSAIPTTPTPTTPPSPQAH